MNRSSPVSVALLILAFVSPLLYVASCGPAIWCRDRGIISQRQVIAVYTPVGWTIENVPIVGGMINKYCNLWSTPKAQRADP
jgi:hypothetical protein